MTAATTQAWTPWSGPSRATELGAGEIVVNSMDSDGTQGGYDLELNKRHLGKRRPYPSWPAAVPVSPNISYDAIRLGKADAVLAASIFHFGVYSIGQVKEFLAERGVPIRPGNPVISLAIGRKT